jgi:hypothetical protein
MHQIAKNLSPSDARNGFMLQLMPAIFARESSVDAALPNGGVAPLAIKARQAIDPRSRCRNSNVPLAVAGGTTASRGPV